MLIVIVDDEPIMCRSIAAVLDATEQSYVVEQFSGAHCGSSVLKWLELHEPDYCILDVLLNGVSGLDVADKVMELYPNTQIILMTGCTDNSEYYAKTLEYAKKYQNIHYLLKRENNSGKTFIGSLLDNISNASDFFQVS